MSYEISWSIPQTTLCVKLLDAVTFQDFIAIDRDVTLYLGKNDRLTALIVDTSEAKSIPQHFEKLKASQTYIRDSTLRFICVVGQSKFMRLMMMLVFNLSGPSLQLFDNLDKAQAFLDRFGRMERNR